MHPALRRRRSGPCLGLLLGLLAGVFGPPPGSAWAGCGGHHQPPCSVEPVRTPCGACDDKIDYCAGCYETALECRDPDLDLWYDETRGVCRSPPNTPVPRPQPVDFLDGSHHVTMGFHVRIDLARATVVIPRLGMPATCDGINGFPSPLATLAVDPNAPTVPNWAESSAYRSRLAINGSFYELKGYYGSVTVHTEVCTHVYGYVLSNGTLVRPEEQIKVSSKQHPPKSVDPGTLVFYTGNSAKRTGRYADIAWYPMFPGNPTYIPKSYRNAISGTQLVRDGAYVGDSVAAPDPNCRLSRTAAGLTMDGRHLILVVVNPGRIGSCTNPKSEATTLAGLAQYLIELGARNAINLDGGGSAQMFYTDYRSPPLRTPPSDKVYLPDFERSKRYYRPVANFLGIR